MQLFGSVKMNMLKCITLNENVVRAVSQKMADPWQTSRNSVKKNHFNNELIWFKMSILQFSMKIYMDGKVNVLHYTYQNVVPNILTSSALHFRITDYTQINTIVYINFVCHFEVHRLHWQNHVFDKWNASRSVPCFHFELELLSIFLQRFPLKYIYA